jgi:hypothetical protein
MACYGADAHPIVMALYNLTSRTPLVGCTCHKSCTECGFSASPTDSSACITCADATVELVRVEDWDTRRTGTCVHRAPQSGGDDLVIPMKTVVLAGTVAGGVVVLLLCVLVVKAMCCRGDRSKIVDSSRKQLPYQVDDLPDKYQAPAPPSPILIESDLEDEEAHSEHGDHLSPLTSAADLKSSSRHEQDRYDDRNWHVSSASGPSHENDYDGSPLRSLASQRQWFRGAQQSQRQCFRGAQQPQRQCVGAQQPQPQRIRPQSQYQLERGRHGEIPAQLQIS